ncbi:MAG: Unknown protein [uncultured Sulfurovum sp.]|uniref:Retropepsin-like aspartic endopeptidase domain-containing protein n=1 Tax=uncultured Sulfurovum sp. TaxID=269237 RepID=A0A6S6SRE5_9BACT|nr:MAG: Unknown protein [uncultured Sulfurovum sp.]
MKLLIFLLSTTLLIQAKEIKHKIIIGAIEKVHLLDVNMVLKARIDTGAKTTSIDAREITPFERNGVKWVRFTCVNGNKSKTIEKKILRTVEIKRHGTKSQNRYVIEMNVMLGTVSRLIQVNLNNRKSYVYPVLIGRNFLRNSFIVDVTLKRPK